MEMALPTIGEYFKEKSVFITGGSGFLGKVFVEKLLRSCPELKAIYFLIRPKKGQSCAVRMEKLFKLPLFKRLREENAKAIEKVKPIPGDISKVGLGICEEDRTTIVENVNIIVNMAATVRFDETLRVAMKMNVVSIMEMVKLAEKIKSLEVFCHLSTAYSQCCNSKDETIEEDLYPVAVEAEDLLHSMSWMSDEMIDTVTRDFVKKYQNTYAFTKSLAEDYINRKTSHLPMLIVRPSIVCTTLTEPMPGWCDNFNGATGIAAAVGAGILRSLYLKEGVVNDVIPCDVACNCIIASIWYKFTHSLNEPVICNCTSGNKNPVSLAKIFKINVDTWKTYPLKNAIRKPNSATTTSKSANLFWSGLCHYAPAAVADSLAVVTGGKPRLLKRILLMEKSIGSLTNFMNRQWKWSQKKFDQILVAIPEDDKKTFDFDPRRIDWVKCTRDGTLGVREYLLKEELTNLEQAKQAHYRLQLIEWLVYIFVLAFIAFFFFIFYLMFNCVFYGIN